MGRRPGPGRTTSAADEARRANWPASEAASRLRPHDCYRGRRRVGGRGLAVNEHPESILIFSGIACLLGTAVPWLVVLVFGGVFDVIFIRREEDKMETQFEDDHKRYKAQVRRWI